MGTTAPVPRKGDKPPRETGMLCVLCNKYGGVAKPHTTTLYKTSIAAGKYHPEWKGRIALKNLNAYVGGDNIKTLMAQQAECNASIMKTGNTLSMRKKKEEQT